MEVAGLADIRLTPSGRACIMGARMLRLFTWLSRSLSYVLDGIDVLAREVGARHEQPCAGFKTNPGTSHNMLILGHSA